MRLLILNAAIILVSCGQDSAKEKEQTQKDSFTQKIDTTGDLPGSLNSVGPADQLTDEAIVNDLLKTNVGNKWRVLTDKDVKDRSSYYDEMVQKERKTNPNFPFIVKADFDGDNKMDYAALVTNDEQEWERLLTRVYVIPAEGKAVTFEESTMPITTLRVVKKSAVIDGHMDDKDKKLVLKTDGLEVITGEAGGYYLYWDGRNIKMLYTIE